MVEDESVIFGSRLADVVDVDIDGDVEFEVDEDEDVDDGESGSDAKLKRKPPRLVDEFEIERV